MGRVGVMGQRRPGASTFRALVLIGLLAGPPEAQAATFIRNAIAAHGGCAFALDFALAGSNLQAPFGKQAGTWTDADLAMLARELAACTSEVAASRNSYETTRVEQLGRDILARMPEIVRRARAEAQRQAEQVAARAAIATRRPSDQRLRSVNSERRSTMRKAARVTRTCR